MLNDKPKKIILLERILKGMAILILKKYNPFVVGITGSVGKTSAKEAIFSVLSSYFRTRKNEKNYNNEIGLPLTIIGCEGGGRSVWKWLSVFLKWLGILVLPAEYPEILVLEMGADRPGDIKYLTDFIKCKVAVVTDISGSHLEYFKTIDKVAREKWSLIENMNEKGTAVINVDNPKILKLKNQQKKEEIQFLTFGFSEEADIRAAEVLYNYAEENNASKKEIKGISFKLSYKGATIPVRLNNILARHNIYAALAGIAVGLGFKLNLVEIAAALENFSLPSGRMNLIAGIKNTFIIDDTYNASLISTVAALEVLKEIQAERKIVVLGDMLELGKNEEMGHRDVAKKFLEINGNIFLAVGERMQIAADELEKRGFDKNNIYVFSNPMEAGKKLQEIMREGDLILIKGSQSMRMEKIVEEIMAEPQNAASLLCRQSIAWKNKPWEKV